MVFVDSEVHYRRAGEMQQFGMALALLVALKIQEAYIEPDVALISNRVRGNKVQEQNLQATSLDQAYASLLEHLTTELVDRQ